MEEKTPNNKKKIILVTGGAGFIGSNLIEELVKDSHNQVISLDNYFTGTKENHIEGAEYREGHTKDIAQHIPETPDLVYHLGEYSRVAVSLKEPEKVWDLNMAGTFGVLEFCRKRKCKLIYAGSSTKFTEARSDGVLGRNLAPYTWSKAINTELVQNYSNWYGLSYVIVYFYNVYGPGELTDKYGAVVGIFKRRYLEDKPLEVREPGTQMRCFTHVSDTVSGIILAGEKGSGDGYGIGAEDCLSLMELAKLFGKKIVMLPPTQSTRSSSEVDSTKIKELGWKPTETLREYINIFIKENLQ